MLGLKRACFSSHGHLFRVKVPMRWESTESPASASSPSSESTFKGTMRNVKLLNPSAAWITGGNKGFRTEEAGKKPIKLRLEAGKTYSFCACGLGNVQPWCDGNEKGFSQMRPINFTVDRTGDYWLCMCKTSKTQPLCDGSHKTIDQTPKDHDAELRFAVTDDTEVYEGVALQLGYKTHGGGFQRG